ncbi:MAG: DUF4832 domain-containing protein [Balneolales bacterium]
MRSIRCQPALYALIFLFIMISTSCSDRQKDETVQIQYEQTDEMFPNPERGFYARQNWVPGTPPMDAGSLRQLREEDNITIIDRSYYIEDFIHLDFTPEFLELIEQDFQAVREAGAKSYFRFRYSVRIGDPDAPLDRVLAHIDQLEPIMQRNYDVIAFVQGGFIGAWGEWHASTNDLTSTENMRAILFRLMDVVPERTVGIRYPEAKMRIFDTEKPLGPENAYDGSYRSRAAHLNDCFLASPTDVGTYRIDAEWEKEYLSLENRYLPMGGETCNPRPDAGDRFHCETALAELDQMSYSYLNRSYSRRILDTWVEQGCMPEVKRRLGYRFALQNGTFSSVARPGGSFDFNLTLVNHGFASPYNPRNLQVILRNVENPNELWKVDLPDDPRFWHGGETVQLSHKLGLPSAIPEGSYDLFLHLPDPEESLHGNPDYSIRLANQKTWGESTGFNRLLHQVTIDPSLGYGTYSGELMFYPDNL